MILKVKIGDSNLKNLNVKKLSAGSQLSAFIWIDIFEQKNKYTYV